IFQDRVGDMWIATTSGASRLHDGTFTTFRAADGLADDRVLTICDDEDGGVWLGTYRGGLSRFKSGAFARVSTKNGLYDDTILHILDDGRGNFWMSSAHGVFRVARRELDAVADGKAPSVTSVVYDKEDGLPTPDMGGGTQPAGWRAKDGRLWFPTGRGPTVVDPAAIRVNDIAPTVIVESVLYDRVHPGGATSAVLPPGSKTLEFHYTATALSAPERTRFRYRLEPFEVDWVDAGPRRVAYYTSLRPGRYRFHVTAANESGVWNETGAVYDLRVKPRFYETVPFYAAVVGLVAFAVWGSTRLRIRQIEARHAAVLAERSRIARELHDTVAQGFTGVSMQLEAVSARLSDAAGAREHLDRARALVRESLADARRSVRALRPAVLESKDLGTSLRAVAAGLTDGVGIAASVTASGERLPAEIEDALFRVGQEAMTNAIRHGRCKTLRVDLSVAEGSAKLGIEDDGRGFDANTVSAGSGLTGMRERIATLGGTLAVESAKPHGTRVVATVPLRVS
ncbi:MAG TPA: histidine kinase, partial [Candidatus Polarisedimenticolaceae bacterium]|nr:histidine kinase [Candidatus Polarisedimenticolaceae bacterium]